MNLAASCIQTQWFADSSPARLQHRALSCDGKSRCPEEVADRRGKRGIPGPRLAGASSRATRDATLARWLQWKGAHQPLAAKQMWGTKTWKGQPPGSRPSQADLRSTSTLDLTSLLPPPQRQRPPSSALANKRPLGMRQMEHFGQLSNLVAGQAASKQAGSCGELAESALVPVRRDAKEDPEKLPFLFCLRAMRRSRPRRAGCQHHSQQHQRVVGMAACCW